MGDGASAGEGFPFPGRTSRKKHAYCARPFTVKVNTTVVFAPGTV